MTGHIRDATAALEKAIKATLPATARPSVSVGRPGWSWRDLLGNRVNICLVRVREDYGQSNDMLPSRPNARAVSLTYIVTFYGRTVEEQLQATMEILVKRPDLEVDEGARASSGSGYGISAHMLNTTIEELAEIWAMFRRKYAPSIILEVNGTIIGAD